MADIVTELDALATELITQLTDPGLVGEARQDVLAAAAAVKDQAFANALANFRAGTAKFIETSTKLAAATAKIADATLRKRIQKLLADLGELQAQFTVGEPSKAPEDGEEAPVPKEDETDTPPPPDPEPLPDHPPEPVHPLVTPKPVNSTKFAKLRREYETFYLGAAFRSKAAKEEAMRLAKAAAANREKYEAAVEGLGIPWWFVSAAHILESGANFTRHLHNGDSLKRRTVKVPAGRPASGSPPFTWPESARDAMKFHKLDGLRDWSLARALYRWETYNGFGYRPRKIPSPYLWSLTTLYEKGKYIRDRVFDANAVSKQCGTVPFLLALIELGEVEPFVIDGVDKGTVEVAESGDTDHVTPNDTAGANSDFKSFFAAQIPGVKHFTAEEFLTKGASHFAPGKAHGLNTDPPHDMWRNVIPLVRLLDRFREEFGSGVRLSSVYRSPKYNAAIDGSATRSQHMEFRAADITVPDKGTPKQWAAKFREMRGDRVFSGGIGIYRTFVHVDVRGSNADWKGKGVA